MEEASDWELGDWQRGKTFEIRLLLFHPTMHPNSITTSLSVAPDICNAVGELRTRLDGVRLPGVHMQTEWSASRRFVDTRFFFKACVQVLAEVIEPRAEFMRAFVETGGSAILIVDARGSMNTGDVLSVADMRRFIAVGVEVGLEVFPRSND